MIEAGKEGDEYVERIVIIPDYGSRRNIWIMGNAQSGQFYETQT